MSAAETLALHPTSKIAKENLDVFCEAWESQLSDMSILVREINDVFEGKRGKKADRNFLFSTAFFIFIYRYIFGKPLYKANCNKCLDVKDTFAMMNHIIT